MRVLTYNVHGCRGIDGVVAPRRIAAVLRAVDADVVALQEVFSGGRAHGASNQLAMLAEATGLTPVAGPADPASSTGYGNGLLVRHPVMEVAICDLTVTGREPRAAVEAVLRRDGVPAAVVVTHLGLGRRERLTQLGRLLEWIARRPSLPRIVAGDLNEWNRWSGTWRTIERHFDTTAPVRTFPTRRPLFPLDRVLVSRPGRVLTTALHRDLPARVASDHLPVVATVDPGAASQR